MSHGSRNLIILGCATTLFALITTSISLAIYHNSGDIYLDRSRPGFLPAETESPNKNDNFTFSDSGSITPESLKEYLEHYESELESLDQLGDPFSADALSDESLGISGEN